MWLVIKRESKPLGQANILYQLFREIRNSAMEIVCQELFVLLKRQKYHFLSLQQTKPGIH
jgi:hypothetical protein